jgi:hypothetical protein
VAAHAIIFDLIDKIVYEDTGNHLQWRHIHSSNLDDHVGIVHFAIDQHQGQDKVMVYLLFWHRLSLEWYKDLDYILCNAHKRMHKNWIFTSHIVKLKT